eukprot:Nk52_evm12s310 gene=Nk52_evmTU12s310
MHLKTLVLDDNLLTELPEELGRLRSLKYLSVCGNQLESLPDTVKGMESLERLFVRDNLLKNMPILPSGLLTVDISGNPFTEFPKPIGKLTRLSELISCRLQKCTSEGFEDFDWSMLSSTLVKVNMSHNGVLTEIPSGLAGCVKLKELELEGLAALKDRKLAKMITSGSNSKKLIDYLKKKAPKASGGGGKKKKGSKCSVQENLEGDMHLEGKFIHIIAPASVAVEMTNCSSSSKKAKKPPHVRGHIVCCVLRNIDLEDPAAFKKFISIQNEVHKTVCDKRRLGTIGTHDMNAIEKYMKQDEENGARRLLYTEEDVENIYIEPLKELSLEKDLVTAKDLICHYQSNDKDMNMKRYVKLISNRDRMAFMSVGQSRRKDVTISQSDCEENDNSNSSNILKDGLEKNGNSKPERMRVISLPPLTNAKWCGCSQATKNVFIEVTSSTSQTQAREIMDALLQQLCEDPRFNIEIDTAENADHLKGAYLEQVLIWDAEKQVQRSVYPGKADLVGLRNTGMQTKHINKEE